MTFCFLVGVVDFVGATPSGRPGRRDVIMRYMIAFVVCVLLFSLGARIVSNHGPALGLARPGRHCYIGEMVWGADGYITTSLKEVVFEDGDERDTEEYILYSFVDVGEGIAARARYFWGGSIHPTDPVSQGLTKR